MGKRAAEHGRHVTNLSLGVNVHYVLRNMFSKIFSLGEFHNSPNFLPPMCSCNKFAKFSRCQSFPPYGRVFGLFAQTTIIWLHHYIQWCTDYDIPIQLKTHPVVLENLIIYNNCVIVHEGISYPSN